MPQNPVYCCPRPAWKLLINCASLSTIIGLSRAYAKPGLESVQPIKTITESMAKPFCDPCPESDPGPDISVRSASSIVERIRRAVISSAILDSDPGSDFRRGTNG